MDPYNSADARMPVQQPPALPPANPYAAPAARIADAAGNDDYVKASRGARLGAVMLDGLVVAVPAMLIAILVPATSGGTAPSTAGMILLMLFGVGAIAFVAMQLVLLHRHGQTIGKKLIGIRIVRTDGTRAGLGRIFLLRSFVPGLIGAIPLLGPIFSLVDILFIFGEEQRCVHDMIADTIVVNA
jgi:uncharacterized RDD family membrane protein YckC